MRLLARLTGSGKDTDPYRVDLPTWSLIALDYAALEAVIDVPETDLPSGLGRHIIPRPWLPGGVAEVVILPPPALQAWQQLIRERYPQGYSAWLPARAVGP